MGRNDQAVTAPVDVLAVMDRMVRSVGARTDKNRDADLAAAHEASAAVAELIEAAAEGVASGCPCETCERLRAALARVGGA